VKLTLLVATAATLAANDAARAVLSKHCLACHGEAKMGGLDLRDRASLLKGGTRGPAVVAGKSAESLLIKAVRREGALAMPPGKAVLSAPEIDALKNWIDSGAAYDGAVTATSKWWSFQKVNRPEGQGSIDKFIDAKLAEKGLARSPRASRRTLIRRATFDLHGLPPTPEEIANFEADTAPNAFAKVVDRLLASPRYGERWARHWLDTVRYADTGGYETDVYFRNAWRYRDYVIRALNEDRPYDVFIKEQIAGDEIWPTSLDLEGAYEMPKQNLANLEHRLGTSLYTLGALPVENSFFGDQYRSEWQAEAVETTAAAFLGLTMGCARCHDHKFDPITQKDFYRMSAFFGGSEDREVPIVSQMRIFEYTRHETRWVLVEQLKAKLAKLPRNATAERDAILKQIGEAYVKAPVAYDKANLLVHTEPVHDTHLLQRGEWNKKGEKVLPGTPGSLGNQVNITGEPDNGLFIPRRRKALAEWLASKDHPLTARVMVNRVWQNHFGRGIVSSTNDFGRQGDPPSHPELLEWLSAEFMDNAWSLKKLHRTMMLSETYQSSSAFNAKGAAVDAENTLLWRMNRRRLEAEAIRDSLLSAAGNLKTKMFGPAVVTPVVEEEMDGVRDASQWPVTADSSEYDRRSIYLFVKRSFRLPMMETFDTPDTTQSCARRESSTVAPQALAMMNGAFTVAQAKRFGARIEKADPAKRVETAFEIALGRQPSAMEKAKAQGFLDKAGVDALALLLFNMSEFVYVD
jgi:cytochrome c553